MVVWPIYPWYFDLSIHGILTSLSTVYWPPDPWCIDPVRMLFWPIYPWYFDPSTNSIWTPLSMVVWAPYPLYSDPLPISWLEMQGVKMPWWFNLPYMGEGKFSERGVNIPWMQIEPAVKMWWEYYYHMPPATLAVGELGANERTLHCTILW